MQVPILNNIIIEKKIGEGGFGIVYRGVLKDEQSGVETMVAIKTLKNNTFQEDTVCTYRCVCVMKGEEREVFEISLH